ncbi:uncharacterized protein C5orf34 homolog isoform X4 [Haemorhous mexicanus]|uniref:uncharacterized protein C5orf34 homolog isoform X4 n=1 Tax=Haemorhous mexicanus TaxID=30427 RepID=UPI0028BD6E99|nr:uncharacterized protein C5orf34 homolog isoform X4 [Haemorhous mexicanus]
MEAERLMVLFGDDSVEVHYAGGSRLLLSPCGSEYLYEAALPAAAHPLQPAETTRQRVAFVVSAYREQLLRALDFRNAFSARPYLPSRVIPPERKKNEDTDKYSFHQLIQVVWCQGVFYRFIHGRTNITEIYPGDDSFFKSEGEFLGKYFVRYAIQKGTKKVEEKMYSVISLPPDVPGHPYSISSIITQATKILQYCCKTKLSLSHSYYLCCWKVVSETDGREMLPVLLHEKVIPSTGRLVVYSDHKVHAVFLDRMSLTMVWDFSSSSSEIQINEDIGWCKLTTPDGLQQLIQISNPGVYERYIRTAIEWCKSLNERREIAEYPAHSVTEENWSADAELEKIQRFNFLLDNSNILKRSSATKSSPSGITARNKENGGETEELSEDCVLEALEKTSKVIQDIESLLAASGR